MSLYDFLFGKSYTNKEWHMVYGERIALLYILSQIRPRVSLEIGTYKGGSLAPISHFSDVVYSIDYEHGEGLRAEFTNVHFVSGDSKEKLPGVIQTLNENDKNLEFVLVDGDHSEEGVRNDINNILKFIPTEKPVYILMHDSFNPDVRNGILRADWDRCPYVHFFDIDFVHGTNYDRQDIHKEMWGGLALAILMPVQRNGDISFLKSQEFLFQTALKESSHNY